MFRPQKHGLLATSLSVAILMGAAFADETPTHYAAVPSETLTQAVENFVVYSARIEKVLAREPLTVDDIEAVHELTYTLEEALARMNQELADLPDILEALHQASEGENTDALRQAAAAYLDKANAFRMRRDN